MLSAVLAVISASIVLSSAQIPGPGPKASPECMAAYNATFGRTDLPAVMNCSIANALLYLGVNDSNRDEHRMTVCDADQQCNSMIETLISACGDMVSSLASYIATS